MTNAHEPGSPARGDHGCDQPGTDARGGRRAQSRRRAGRILDHMREEQARDERAVAAEWNRLPADERERRRGAWIARQRRADHLALVADCHTLVDLATAAALAAYALARLAERADRPAARIEWDRAGERLHTLNNRYARAARRFGRGWYGSVAPEGLAASQPEGRPDSRPDSVERPESDTRDGDY